MNFVATGLIDGEKVTFKYSGGKLQYPPEYATHVDIAVLRAEPIGGTYFIRDQNDPLDAHLLVQHYIFDSAPEIELNGEVPTLPYEEGVIY